MGSRQTFSSSCCSIMLDSLSFLLEKLFLLAHLKLSILQPPPFSSRSDRDESPPTPAGAAFSFQRGDLLEVPRTLFTHFGICLGDNRVAHLIPDALPLVTADSRRTQLMVTNTRLLLGVLSKRATIRVDSVEDFAYGARVLPNGMDMRWSPLAEEEVARRAERLVGSVSYSLLWNNCEHFVTYCRYGSARSLQTDKVRVRRRRTGLVLGAIVRAVRGSSCRAYQVTISGPPILLLYCLLHLSTHLNVLHSSLLLRFPCHLLFSLPQPPPPPKRPRKENVC